MHDRALQHHRARADIVDPPVVVEREHPRSDQHKLVPARRQVEMEIGRTCIRQINRQVGRNLVQQEGLVVGVEAFVCTIVERLRPIGCLIRGTAIAIDSHEVLVVQANGTAVRVSKTKPLLIKCGMNIHDVLQTQSFRANLRHLSCCSVWRGAPAIVQCPRDGPQHCCSYANFRPVSARLL